MNSTEFEAYLRNLQTNGYIWPNDYFAWEKPDGSLFMVGVRSGQHQHILRHELEEDRLPQLLKMQEGLKMQGNLVYQREYVSGQYSIDPKVAHLHHMGDGPLVEYDPVKELAQEVSSYKYLGTWRDQDILMDAPHDFNRVLACGRWELAKVHIPGCEKFLKNKPLDAVLSEAQSRAGTAENRQGNAKEIER